jgi:hypothetical protein
MEQQKEKSTALAPQLAAPAALANPFARAQSEHLAHGAVAIESERAVAEAQGKLVIAKRFPRDPFKAFERIREACQRSGLASEAFYSYNRGGSAVTGPSIRLAEELARCWGNIDYGLRELSNRDGVSEMEAYAWDMETNTISKQQFTVRHLRDTKGGAQVLTDQRDIYEIAANMGARRMRARILAILPADLVDAAVAECRATLAKKGSSEPLADRIKRMLAAFSALGVTAKLIEERLGHPLDQTLAEELVDLQGIHTSIKEGHTKAGEWFGAKLEAPAAAQQQAQPEQQQGTPKMEAPKTDAAKPKGGKAKPKTDAPAQEAAASAASTPAPAAAQPEQTTAAPAPAAKAEGEKDGDLF